MKPDMKSEAFLMDCMEGMKNTPDNYYDLAVVVSKYFISLYQIKNI